MNTKLLEEIVLWLEAGAPHEEEKSPAFDIRIGYAETEGCGTVCCIAGAACFFGKQVQRYDNDDEYEEEFPWDLVFDTAMELLDIEYYQADALFEPPYFDKKEMKSVYTPENVAIVLRHFMNTGEIDWDLIMDRVEIFQE